MGTSGPAETRPARAGRSAAVLVLRSLVIIVALALAAIPVVVLVATAVGTPIESADRLLGFDTPLSQTAVQSSQTEAATAATCGRNDMRLVLVIHQVDVDAGTVLANAWMCLGSNDAKGIFAPGDVTGPSPPTVDIAGLSSTFAISLRALNRTEQLTAALNHTPGAMVPVGSVTLPLDGSPRAYPLDHYGSPINISETGYCAVGPLPTTIVADPGAASLDWVTAQPEYVLTPPADATRTRSRSGKTTTTFICGGTVDSIALEAHRPLTTKLFVLCLIGIPLLLLGLLSMRLSEGTPRSIDGLVGVIAIMLAILPIRTVLVPGDITSLTLVDFALATEMALLATGTVWWFLLPRRRAAAKPPG